jgi:hypothetical protein
MQLILPQSDLEQAIKNYVNDLVNIKEGTTIEIDLKAGRGLDGFTATVDINKIGGPSAPKTVVPAALPMVQPVREPSKGILRGVAVPVPETVAEPEAQPEAVQQAEADPVPEVVELPTPEAEATKSEQPKAATPKATEEPAAVAATPTRRPIFGNLKKPE